MSPPLITNPMLECFGALEKREMYIQKLPVYFKPAVDSKFTGAALSFFWYNRSEHGSPFKKLKVSGLQVWLEENYALGDLWKKTLLGGRAYKMKKIYRRYVN